jgi:hypothetical protein
MMNLWGEGAEEVFSQKVAKKPQLFGACFSWWKRTHQTDREEAGEHQLAQDCLAGYVSVPFRHWSVKYMNAPL